MKLKTIDIKAFRLFEKQHLDFTNNQPGKGEGCANFVSIYAPNGFGKTSLFDAIEFGMTGNIHRLKIGNFDEQMKCEGRISDISSFIHNKKMRNEKVRIELGLDGFKDGVVVQEVDPKNEKDMLQGESHNSFFTNAILSQDWFSEFLSAATAEDRFESFMRNFHQSKDLLEYLKKLKSTRTSLNRERGDKQKKLDRLKTNLTNDVDEHILERLEKTIAELKEKGVQLNWQRRIDADSLTKMKLERDLAIGEIEMNQNSLEHTIANIQGLLAGQDGLISPNNLEGQRNNIDGLKKQLEVKNNEVEKIKHLKNLLVQTEQLQKERRDCAMEVDRLAKLIEGFDVYMQILSKLEEQKKIINSCDESSDFNKNEEKRLNILLQEAEKQKESIQQQLTILTNKLSTLDVDYAKYGQLLVELSNKDKQVSTIQANIVKKNEERAALNAKKEDINRIYKIVVERNVEAVIDDYKEQSQTILEIKQGIKQKEEKIRQEEESIEQQTSYKGLVEELLVRARGMVDEMKNGICPLCGYDYGKTDALLERIENNQAVSSAIEAAMGRIALLKQEITIDKNRIEDVYKALLEQINESYRVINEKLEANHKDIAELNFALSEAQQAISANKKIIDDNYKEFEGLQIEQIRQRYENNKLSVAEKLESCELELKTLKEKIEGVGKLLAMNDQKRNIATETVQAILKSEDYQAYRGLLKNDELVNEAMLSQWELTKQEKGQNLNNFDLRLGEIQNTVHQLTVEEGVDITKEAELSVELARLSVGLSEAEKKFQRTIQFIKSESQVESATIETPTAALIALVNEKKTDCESRLLSVKEKRRDLESLLILIEAAGKYNQQQLLKKEIKQAEDLLKGVERDQLNVKTEIEKLQSYLENYVKNFFQVDLINELYNRIDPHPEYKEVRFECDFTFTHPRLNVYMGTRDEKNDQIVPNLYFSTAQVNILSFCIFLAKAMFAKTDDGQDVGCIFIDDPIQALDDINILSMIDLLRNVAFTMDRQIVITTHDQNFFGLLQKKIPQEKFNASYWEIYERGKFRKVMA